MPGAIDMLNQKVGRLLVIERAGSNKDGKAVWLCKCDCGNELKVIGKEMRTGHTLSCGCLRKETTSEMATKHGNCNHPLYRVWHGMINRCEKPKHKNYREYGARGIKVSLEWHKFEKFFADMVETYDIHIKEHGKINTTLERVNNSADYSKDNCIWTTRKQQGNNTRRNRFITFNGETKTLAQWAESLGINYGTLSSRINRQGLTIEDAFTLSVGSMSSRKPKQTIGHKESGHTPC